MAYVPTGAVLTDEACAALVALSQHLDLAPGPGGARITPAWGAAWAACRDVLGYALPGVVWTQATSQEPDRDWPRIQFVVLSPSRQISAHRDPPIQGRRIHIPVAVNQGCWSFHGGAWQQLTLGHVYEMDPTVEHGAVNWGATTRLHLIIDTEAR